ncbi:DNA double-strand break repair nuclease NurA [Salinithrix halophila]|uniref:DNA double-strand break repair nuclease NurA n=1 Tax=Salinithrix halophila TaxID=1485204 RepID=A0ABV8J9K7_9BACL
MLPVSLDLKQKLQETNRELRRMYPPEVFDREKIREGLKEIGAFSPIEKWADDGLRDWLAGGTLVGVDGSVNSTPGSYPHTLSVFQALAKGTRGEEYWAADLYTPLLDAEEEEEIAEGRLAREAKHRGSLLASLEIGAAMEAISRWRPRVVMMDGSLLHFLIDDAAMWEKLASTAIEKGVLLVGVSEEIGTKSLARRLFPGQSTYSDRDLLFGALRSGEAYLSPEMNPAGTGLWKAILSSSRNPQPVGIDGLAAQEEFRDDLIRLVHTLTPAQGRGVPLWLDIVDKEVRVTDALVHAMVEQYIDPDLRHRLLHPKRKERHL